MNIRGVGLHEDSKAQGFAIDNARREQLVNDAKELGATVLRTHYPLHPYTHELADRLGLLIWSEIPVYSVKTEVLKEPAVRRAGGRGAEQEHRRQREPPVGDAVVDRQRALLAARAGAGRLHQRGGQVRQASWTRRARSASRSPAYPSSLCQAAEYASLDVIGFNDYFGWYPGPSGQIFDRTKLSGYLDAARACYPNQALMVTEFGAEANRDGPVEEKGTWAFQQDWINYQLGVIALQAVAQRRDLLGAERVLGAARAGTAATRAPRRRSTRRA